jgi:hypothetical protein
VPVAGRGKQALACQPSLTLLISRERRLVRKGGLEPVGTLSSSSAVSTSDLFLGTAHRIIVTGRARFVMPDAGASGSIDCVGRARKLLRRVTALRLAPRLSVFHSALRFPKESASEREGFIIQASA